MKLIFAFLIFVQPLLCIAQFRITGGYEIDIRQAPWQVLINSNSGTCGGSIVSPHHVLTAKHCVAGVSTKNIKVIAGVSSRSNVTSLNEYSVSSIILHPTLDVALLKLSSAISFDDTKQSINVLESINNKFYEECSMAIVSGWGWLKEKSYAVSERLHAVDVHIISNAEASAMLQMPVYEDEVAVVGIGPIRQGACHGDSGGPLVVWYDDIDNYVLIGVVSRGRSECTGDNTNSPSIFVRTSSIVGWLVVNTITITGLTQICNSKGTFKINNLPADATVHWNAGGGRLNAVELASGQGTAQATYRATGNGQGTVSATVSYQGASTTLSQMVWAGAPSAELDVSSDGIARASACLRTDPLTMHAEPPVWQLWNPSQRVNFVEDEDGRCGRVRGAAGDWNIRGTVTLRNGCGEAAGRFSMNGISQTAPCPRQLEQRGSGSNLTVMYTKPIDCPVWPIRGAVAEQPVAIEVYDRMGRLVLRQQGELVGLGHLRPGLYIVRARSGDEVATLTVVRE